MGGGNRDQWDVYKDIFQRHFDQTKVYMAGVVEYGKFLVQTLFALNGLGFGAIQTLRIVLDDRRQQLLSSAVPQISFVFVAGAVLAIISAYLAYWNFLVLTNEQFSKWKHEWENFRNSKSEPFVEGRLKNILHVLAHVFGILSLILFCFACFRLYCLLH